MVDKRLRVTVCSQMYFPQNNVTVSVRWPRQNMCHCQRSLLNERKRRLSWRFNRSHLMFHSKRNKHNEHWISETNLLLQHNGRRPIPSNRNPPLRQKVRRAVLSDTNLLVQQKDRRPMLSDTNHLCRQKVRRSKRRHQNTRTYRRSH